MIKIGFVILVHFKRNGVKEHIAMCLIMPQSLQRTTQSTFFQIMDKKGLIQLRIVDHVGCEKFAEYVSYINSIVSKETNNRVLVEKVECFEETQITAQSSNLKIIIKAQKYQCKIMK